MSTQYKITKKNNKIDSDVIIRVNNVSSSKKRYSCDNCLVNLSSRQSRWRHIKTCNKKSLVEKRLKKLEDSLNSEPKVESITLIKMMNKQMKAIIKVNKIINSMYWDKKIEKIIDDLKKIIQLNINMFILTSQDYQKFDTPIKNQIKINLDIVNKLNKYLKYVEYKSEKQYIFRNQVNKLQKIKFNNEENTAKITDSSEEEYTVKITDSSDNEQTISANNVIPMKSQDWSDYTTSDTDSSNDI
jgi:hypothetical protein